MSVQQDIGLVASLAVGKPSHDALMRIGARIEQLEAALIECGRVAKMVERERCCDIALACADTGIISWNAAQRMRAAMRADAAISSLTPEKL